MRRTDLKHPAESGQASWEARMKFILNLSCYPRATGGRGPGVKG